MVKISLIPNRARNRCHYHVVYFTYTEVRPMVQLTRVDRDMVFKYHIQKIAQRMQDPRSTNCIAFGSTPASKFIMLTQFPPQWPFVLPITICYTNNSEKHELSLVYKRRAHFRFMKGRLV